MSIDQIRDTKALADTARNAFPASRGFWDVQSLTGFSIRMEVGPSLRLADSSSSGQIVVDTLMRDRVNFVEISNTVSAASDTVTGYTVLQSDGKPLPRWVNLADNGMLLVEVPAAGGTLDLRVIARMGSGSIIERAVSIQLATGEIQEIKLANAAAPLFEEQLRRRAN